MGTTSLPVRDEFARRVYPDALQEVEEKWIGKRRDNALDPSNPPPSPNDPGVGVGISGGGIRSATFALGFFQALARQRLVRTIDFLSTVSGGGYFGAFLGALFGRPFVRPDRCAVDDVEDALAEKEGAFKVAGHEALPLRAPARLLRENGRYLAPNGGGDLLLAGAGLLRNWLVVQLATWISLTTFFVLLHVAQRELLDWLRPRLEQLKVDTPSLDLTWIAERCGLALILGLALIGFWIAPAGWGYWIVEKLRIVLSPGVAQAGVSTEQRQAWRRRRFQGPIVVTAALTGAAFLLVIGEPPAVTAYVLLPLAIVALALVWIAALLGPPFGHRDKPMQPPRKEESIALLAPVGPAVALLLSAGVAAFSGAGADFDAAAWVGVVGVALTLITLAFVSIVMLRREPANEPSNQPGDAKDDRSTRPIGRLRWFRNLITRSFKRGLLVLAFVAALAVVASAGAYVHKLLDDRDATRGWFGGVVATIGVALASAKRLLLLVGGGKQERPALTPTMIAGLAALLVAAVLLVGSDVLARMLLDDVKPSFGGAISRHWNGVVLLAAVVVVVAMGRSLRLLNLSSQQAFYGQRLIRAYLGSSNLARLNGGVALAEAVKSDDALPAEYWRNDRGAPLHLVNVTINETFDGKSQVEQRDRKGVALAIGPCGVSAGTRHHALVDWKQDPPVVGKVAPEVGGFRVFGDGFLPQTLTIGEWVAISGAAFSTGLGAKTNLGMSLLCGLANVRLGIWWDAHVRRGAKVRGLSLQRGLAKLLPLQGYLLNEFLAQFPGPSWRHWYLSDGGHFENLGGYELIRRQLKCIVILDGEQDADYRFEGLGNLVRLARVDFDTDIRFLDEAELDAVVHADWRSVFGSLEHLRRGDWTGAGTVPDAKAGRASARLESAAHAGRSLAHAALARVRYPGSGGIGCLLYVKTTLVGDEPADLAHYHSQHADFPHESTTDQFFDEAQWESYRKLGDHVAAKLFDPARRHPRDVGGPPNPPAATGTWEPEHLLRGVLPLGLDQLA